MTLTVRRMLARGGRGRSEGGSALVEFVFLGVLVLVPLIYLVMVALLMWRPLGLFGKR